MNCRSLSWEIIRLRVKIDGEEEKQKRIDGYIGNCSRNTVKVECGKCDLKNGYCEFQKMKSENDTFLASDYKQLAQLVCKEETKLTSALTHYHNDYENE